MTMHLAHPSLSLTGKKKGKVKFRNAEEARKSRELDQSWKDLLTSHGIEQEARRRKRAMSASTYVPPARTYRGADEPRLPSRDTGGGVATLAPAKVYTGDKIVGIAAMQIGRAHV